jgi:hypothetical protein
MRYLPRVDFRIAEASHEKRLPIIVVVLDSHPAMSRGNPQTAPIERKNGKTPNNQQDSVRQLPTDAADAAQVALPRFEWMLPKRCNVAAIADFAQPPAGAARQCDRLGGRMPGRLEDFRKSLQWLLRSLGRSPKWGLIDPRPVAPILYRATALEDDANKRYPFARRPRFGQWPVMASQEIRRIAKDVSRHTFASPCHRLPSQL